VPRYKFNDGAWQRAVPDLRWGCLGGKLVTDREEARRAENASRLRSVSVSSPASRRLTASCRSTTSFASWAGSRGRLGLRGNAVDKDENAESAETRFREYQRGLEAIDRDVANLQPAYLQALNSIWIANAGASLATLSFIGATFAAYPVVPGSSICSGWAGLMG
jgi:hypothetical protein